MGLAAKLLARTAQDLIENPEIIDEAQLELESKRGADFEYEALLGDREPPLDYRL
jgi:aminobenzoyl-glutamate utilization protein B